MSEKAPPQFGGLSFEYFHPLDGHWPFTAACRAMPPHGTAAGRRHLYLAWHYHRKWQLRRATLCRIGVHEMGHTWHYGPLFRDSARVHGVSYECLHCAHPRMRNPVIHPGGPVSRAVRRAKNMLSRYER